MSLCMNAQILIVVGLLTRVMGLFPALAGLAAACLLIPVTSFLSRRLTGKEYMILDLDLSERPL